MGAAQEGPHLSVDQVVNDKLCAVLGITGDRLILDASLHDTYDLDSLDVIQFVMDVEDTFGIEISDEESEGFTTLRHVIDAVKARLPSGGGPKPEEFEIRDAYEIYSIPSSWNRREIVGRVWNKSAAESYVSKYNQNKGRLVLPLHWAQVRVIFIRGSWYTVMKTPLSIKNSI